MEKSTLDQLRIERGPEKEPGALRWIPVALGAVLLLAAAGWFFLRPDAAIPVATVVVRELDSQVAGTVLNASGYVTARRQATVSSKLTARVTEILIEEGMLVEKGQVLARLDDSNIQASLELTRAQMKSARSALKETEALLSEARANFARTSKLVDRQLASEAELDRSRALTESLAARLAHKQANVEVAARQVDVFLQQVEDTIIRAPFAGVVVAKNAQPGEMISPISAGGGFTRTGIGTIVDMASLEIEIDVNEAYINRVEQGQEVVATLDAYPDWQIPCQVIAIIPTADRQRATVEVRVGFNELDARILPDMGVKVAFRSSATATAAARGLAVPNGAIRRANGRDIVFVVKDGIVERRAVNVVETRGDFSLLAAGLVEGERVVTQGPPDLEAGAKVVETGE